MKRSIHPFFTKSKRAKLDDGTPIEDTKPDVVETKEEIIENKEPRNIKFDEKYSEQNDLILLTAHPLLLQSIKEHEANGNQGKLGKLRIVGDKDKQAILCGKNKCYTLTKVESSNERLLLEPKTIFKENIDDLPEALREYDENDENNTSTSFKTIPLVVKYRCNHHLDVTLAQPQFVQLANLLKLRSFENEETKDNDDMNQNLFENENERSKQGNNLGYSYNELISRVQASEMDLLKGIVLLNAINISKGRWCHLDYDIFNQAMNDIIYLFQEHEWSLNEIPVGDCIELLSDKVNSILVKHCLYRMSLPSDIALSMHNFPIPSPQSSPNDINTIISLDDQTILKTIAHLIFDEKNKWEESKFLDEWGLRLPGSLEPDITLLQGIALKDSKVSARSVDNKQWWVYFPERLLPLDVTKRFQRLFSFREKWKLDDLNPYLTTMETPNMTIAQMLLEHSRIINNAQTGQQYYISQPRF